MARINNLTNFLTDVASAIKTKKGDSTPILASNFDTEINEIKGINDAYELKSTYNPTSSTSSPIADGSKYRLLMTALIKEVPKMTLDFTSYQYLNFGFVNCIGLEKIDVSQWDVSTITSFRALFYGCENLKEIDMSNWTPPSSGNVNLVFKGCTSLTSANLSSFVGGYNIGELFNGCTSLQHIDIRGFDFANCTYVIATGGTNFLGSPTLGYVPTTCEIIVADQTQKDFMTTNFASYTNVKTVVEYEAE